ncbi:ScbR family autoregulator-binding transcription factor [Streptomyces marincola]|uniref:ScbR family autoregulator-binding transcription factor n=1 Tax=Streptomyces marincola TaxID=2878388 RepID=UPI001CF3BB49|nr:ScbR family autoregulator-binding transcription factor [Streptomyces marincola]UCM87573.1 TetR family transcriptional regulator [Streptomyces marincola]
MQERSERTRNRLLAAAAEVIDKYGYADATMSDISRYAQVTKGALYFHFASKTELAQQVQQRSCDLLNVTIEELRGANASALQTLIDLTHSLACWMSAEPTVRASLRIGRERAGREQQVIDYHLACVSAAWRLLRQARAERVLHEGVAQEDAETLVAALIAGTEATAWRGVPYREVAAQATSMWTLLLSVLVRAEAQEQLRTAPPACAGEGGPPPDVCCAPGRAPGDGSAAGRGPAG